MVAYNFKAEFANAVTAGRKLQTIRAPRATRHARPGEPIQLYTGMRTKACRKLLTPDPKCVAVLPVEISGNGLLLDGVRLFGDQLTAFAIADGFPTVEAFEAFFKRRMPCLGYSLIAWGDWVNPLPPF